MDRRAIIDYKIIVKCFFTVVILLTGVCSMYYLGYSDGLGASQSFSITVEVDGTIVEKSEKKKKETTTPKRKKRYPKPRSVIRRHFNS